MARDVDEGHFCHSTFFLILHEVENVWRSRKHISIAVAPRGIPVISIVLWSYIRGISQHTGPRGILVISILSWSYIHGSINMIPKIIKEEWALVNEVKKMDGEVENMYRGPSPRGNSVFPLFHDLTWGEKWMEK